jgi:hypothetical protein
MRQRTSERIALALLNRFTHDVYLLEINGDRYRLKQSRRKRSSQTLAYVALVAATTMLHPTS